ncbi:MAG: hypothetical protein IJ147_00230 [Lachnospiraceae bacterium]|nr:hypothetical protein [Lachnospiraceae bacterium]MBQ8116482.1 hypothetical protein [Lachnospiraceae bacterium]
MDHLLVLNVAMTLCAAVSFICGAIKYFKPRKPLYATMIVCGVGCIMFGRSYQCVRLLTGYPVTEDFQVGILGIVGAFSFFLSANYGQMDSLVDDGSKAFGKYRAVGWLGTLLIGVLYVIFLRSEVSAGGKIVCGIVTMIIGLACYFHSKHLLIYDVDYGVIRCLRYYNALAFLYGILCMFEMIALGYQKDVLLIAVSIFMCAVSALIIPAMDRGVQKWKT